jgi:DNA-binding transcriptional regulator YiaG
MNWNDYKAVSQRSLTVKTELATAITAWRTKMGFAQPDAAVALGVPVGTLRNWEQGRYPPEHPDTLILAMEALERRKFEKEQEHEHSL